MRLALVALLCCAACHLVAPEKEKWIEAQSDHFVLHTDVDEADAKETIVELEQTRSVYLRAFNWGGGKPRSAAPFQVVELNNIDELHQFAKRELGGFLTTYGAGEPVVVMPADGDATRNRVLKHELAHAVAGQMLRRQAPWFAEGLATFLENTQKDPDAPRDLLGVNNLEVVRWLQLADAMPAAELFSLHGATDLPLGDGARFEGTAYEVFFALFNLRSAGLAALLRMLAHGDDPQAAFRAAFPDLTPEKVDDLRLEMQKRERYQTLGVSLQDYAGAFTSRALTEAEVHAQIAVLFAHGGADRDDAKTRAEDEALAALRLDASNIDALFVLRELHSEKHGDLLVAARSAVSAHPDSWRAQVFLAEQLDHGDAKARTQQADERLAAAQASIALFPDNPDALFIAGYTLGESQRPAEALPLLQRAVSLEPSPYFLAQLAVTQLVLHHLAEARVALQRAYEQAGDQVRPALLARLRKIQTHLDQESQAGWQEIEGAASKPAPTAVPK